MKRPWTESAAPGLKSPMRNVPAAVPLLRQGSRPAESLAVKRRVVAFSATSDAALFAPATPRCLTSTVPALVPLVFQSAFSEAGVVTK